MATKRELEATLPAPLAAWFEGRGWRPHAHQLAMLAAARAGRSALLIAPTGGGKTLAGFLPSLCELIDRPRPGLHTLYVSPLKALAVDIHRNLTGPLEEMGLDIACETRTGDTPQAKRARQRARPPSFLLTTPESLALLLSYPDAPQIFGDLSCVIVDELHALAETKRGDLLALGLARLGGLAPTLRRVGLSATVADAERLSAWIAPSGRPGDPTLEIVRGRGGAEPAIEILETRGPLPWSGHMGVQQMPEVYERIRRNRVTLVFVNTRAQAELCFQELWRLNEEGLPIGLHHGSLAREQRRKVEAAMAAGKLRAVVATSSLDLGIDWAEVDLVIQVGAPKGVSRLIQRLGRANHRLDQPSRALLVPSNRFEVLECRAAHDGVRAHTLDGEAPKAGGFDVLAQHILGVACAGPFDAEALWAEVRGSAPYADLARKDFDDVLSFAADGGYALRAYQRYRRLARDPQGLWRITSTEHIRRYRMNLGTIVEQPLMQVRLGGRVLGEIEEHFISLLEPDDTFVFAGRLLRFVGIRETTALVAKGEPGGEPKVPAYAGARMPLSTHLADRVRAMLEDPGAWDDLPAPVAEWLAWQRRRSVLPPADGLLIESFPRGSKEFLVAYCFEGRNAHQTLGMLLTKRMERAGWGPLGFVATDYVIAVWSLKPVQDIEWLFDEDILGDDLEEWMADSSLLKRTFRNVAVIAGLIERRRPGQEQSRRQVTFNSDLIYDVLRKHEPDHVLLRATRADAASGLIDLSRVSGMLARAKDRIRFQRLDRVSPLAVPVLLEIGRESVAASALDELLDEGAQALIAEAMEESAPATKPRRKPAGAAADQGAFAFVPSPRKRAQ